MKQEVTKNTDIKVSLDGENTNMIPGVSDVKIPTNSISVSSGVIAQTVTGGGATTRIPFKMDVNSITLIAQSGSLMSVGAMSIDGSAGSGYVNDTSLGGSGGSSVTLGISGISGIIATLRRRSLLIKTSGATPTTNIIVHYFS